MTLNLNNKICLPTLKLLGDFWALRILDSLSNGGHRYCELQRMAGDINPVTLTNRLKELQKNNLIKRQEVSRAEVVYSLTPLGEKTIPVLSALNSFAEAARAQSR